MENRRDERAGTGDAILLGIGAETLRVTMLNLSRDGCLVEGHCPGASAGQDVEITLLDGVTAPGAIVWTDETRIGISFDRRLGEATVKYFRLAEIDHAGEPPIIDRFGRGMPPLRSNRKFG